MHEYVKKALVTALLIVSAAIVPFLLTAAGFPDRSSKLARAVASPWFWQIWDNLPSREAEDWILTYSDDCQESDWTPEFRNLHTCLFFQAYLKPAFEGYLSAVGEYDGVLVSIRTCVIGCTPGRAEIIICSEHSARYGFYQESHISGGINATKDDTAETYLALLNEDPGGSLSDAVGTNRDEWVILPDSHRWFVHCLRDSDSFGGHLWLPASWIAQARESRSWLDYPARSSSNTF
jgi:hypothetical protein